MGVYDSVMVPCPSCGEKQEAQSKSGKCLLEFFELSEAPDDVLADVNRHAPFKCKCGTTFFVELETKTVGKSAQWPSSTSDIDNRNFVIERLYSMLKAPKMWAFTCEAFVAQIVVLLELMKVPQVRDFQREMFGGGSSTPSAYLRQELEDEWAKKAISRALELL